MHLFIKKVNVDIIRSQPSFHQEAKGSSKQQKGRYSGYIFHYSKLKGESYFHNDCKVLKLHYIAFFTLNNIILNSLTLAD